MSAPTASNSSEFVISREFAAPRTAVFRAWTDPKILAQWWGPHTFTCPVCEVDLRQGGAYRIVMRSPEGEDYPIKGVFHEIAEPEGLVMTVDCSEHPDSWHDMINPNRVKGPGRPELSAFQLVTFEPNAAGTRLTLRARFDTPEILQAMLRMGMQEGWDQSLERLAGVL